MLRMKNFAISIILLSLVALPSTTSSHRQENSPDFSPQRTSLPDTPQRSRGPQSKFVKVQNAIPNRYIVLLNDDVVSNDSPREARLERVREIANEHALAHAGRVDYLYETALKGYAIELPNEAAARAISNRPEVQWVEEDDRLELGQAPASPQATPPWGLDGIDGTFPTAVPNMTTGRTNGTYVFNGNGAGVNAYVLDTGINTAHADFQTGFGSSRAAQAGDCIRNNDCRTGPPSGFIDAACSPAPNNINNDCHGHGTHVAATLGGNNYGVAKGVSIRSVKVCVVGGGCPGSAVIAGVNFVTNEHVTNNAVPAVANMSIWGPISSPPTNDHLMMDSAIVNSINSGVTYVLIAGNANRDARNYYPGDVAAGLTIGAVDWNGNRWINNANEGSNFGPGVDLFAPGVFILSAQVSVQLGGDCAIWNGTNTTECHATGTSQAAPHVAGTVAMYLQGRTGLGACNFPISGPAPPTNANLSTCPDRVARYIKANANRDKLTSTIHGTITDANGQPVTLFSPNLFIWNSSVPTLPNPIENHRFFVWSQYVDILNREPDSGGFNNWLAGLNQCSGSDWPCINAARIHIVRGFIESGEFRAGKPALSNPTSTAQYNEEYVRQLYLTLLRRQPDSGGLQTYVNELNSTGDYDHTVHGFINAAEYRVRFGPQ